MGFSIPYAKLVLVRFALFTILAIDAFLQIPHAPRYGAGGFNVAHVDLFDFLPMPGRTTMLVVYLALTWLLAVAALGALTRVVIPIAAALYAYGYFGSQLDSYQHHYLVALILGLACFVPWRRPPDVHVGTPVRSWALRLILVQLGIVYLWAAIAKLHGAWLDGTALAQQVATPWIRDLITGSLGWQGAAILILAVELLLAVAVWSRRLWPIAAPLGIAFHLGIELSGLEIGLFSYVMVALYLLVIPDRLVTAIARAVVTPLGRWLRAVGRTPASARGLTVIAMMAATILGPLAVLVAVPFDEVAIWLAVTIVLAGMAGTLVAWGSTLAQTRRDHGVANVVAADRAVARTAVAIALASGLVALLAQTTDVAIDYYRLWGGSSRRLGEPTTARGAYQRILEIDADNGNAHYWLARLDADAGDDGGALLHYRAAQAREPAKARAFIGEARILDRRGDVAGALVAVRAGLAAEPGNREAAALLKSLSGGGGSAPRRPAAPAPEPAEPAEPNGDGDAP